MTGRSQTEDLARLFAPYESLAATLLGRWDGSIAEGDGSHDRSHLMRVWQLVRRIARGEPAADMEVLVVATLFHDCVAVEKNSPQRAMASRLSADVARRLLDGIGWQPARIEAVAHAIEAHSFSAGIAPRSTEAAILRDADRLDALGALGIARVFYIAGRLGTQLYDPDDPMAERRPLDDRRFALDHFETKLFLLSAGLVTPTGQEIGRQRTALMRAFVEDFGEEIAMPEDLALAD
ncbi:phosphohydrolase [Mesorhizobium sp. L-8-10]|uniref:HD domain-containing protein n=1 Tax=Mesorhizobium sp. L-8-10 TaxID=2744523 RepID=UPI0019294F0F|nr:HD domain-containing protein [Mesorhizobium sp. L-8-10]BCH31026.1 phosphohydrolase [Mesorhizobium sp. L-8-10]